jgi:hypothetical protein
LIYEKVSPQGEIGCLMLFTINGNANILKETAAVTNWLRKAKGRASQCENVSYLSYESNKDTRS